ncbi:uncharacterized protein LOC107693870 [Sinocyclocheilus anshuiensis]|uniref:uncharacterized protein LOC107693870 n=1 Tax=Sinocyclocheilus anshuiensis TaxID=1608454 RepID=UPI0007BA99B8|nr:PREDICTED: uncharacterized protein LOC107693870 [Sinocyclocheilus anshuiensis]
MDFLMTESTYKLLIFLCMIRGTYGVLINYNAIATAVEGQNVSLQCIVGEEHGITIIQVEWIKQQKGNEKNDQKIVVFHPGFPTHFFKSGPLLETVTSSKTGKLQGSILTLYKVTVNDSGNYICEITSYPIGSINRTTTLQFAEPPASVKMPYPYGFIKEGDDMKITCSAIPPPLRYKLRRSKNKIFWLESSNGEFILPHVTRNDSDVYICLPEWDSLVPNLQGLNATVELTVNFLDGIECNTSSPLNVSAGEDVAISCIVKASQYLQYKWMRLLRSRMTTNFPVRTTKHLSSFTSNGTSSWSTDTTVSTSESGHFLASTVKPNATLTTLQPKHTSHPTPLTGSSSAPPVGNASTLHASTVKSIDSLSTTPDPATRRRERVTTVITQKNITAVTAPKEPPASVKMPYPYGFIKEGDDMKITCSAIPPPLCYKLRRSKNKIFWLESSNGEFILPHVNRNDSDVYICLPEWDSLVPNLQGLNATVELTVNCECLY